MSTLGLCHILGIFSGLNPKNKSGNVLYFFNLFYVFFTVVGRGSWSWAPLGSSGAGSPPGPYVAQHNLL
jgi:hypothetical protein